jgi:hypothetical protein
MSQKQLDQQLETLIRNEQEAWSQGITTDWDWSQTEVLQRLICNGTVWQLEGAAGRAAIEAIRTGRCFLPDKAFKDRYGSNIPARSWVKEGSAGTLENSARYWEINLPLPSQPVLKRDDDGWED